MSRHSHERLVTILEKVIKNRCPQKAKLNEDNILVAKAYKGVMDCLKLHSVWEAAGDCLPDHYQKKPHLVYQYGRTVGSMCTNVKNISDLTVERMHEMNAGACLSNKPCFAKYVDPHHKHIITNDPKILGCISQDLVDLALEGTKFRPGLTYGKITQELQDEIAQTILVAAANYSKRCINNGQVQGWDAWHAEWIN